MRLNTEIPSSRVSPSMVRAVFEQLKANGYTDAQIVSFSQELEKMGSGHFLAGPLPELGNMTFEIDLSGMAWVV